MGDIQSSEGFFDASRHVAHKIEAKGYTSSTSAEQCMLDYLMDNGFQWDEAVTLMHLREHLYENIEMRQRVTEDYRMHFVKWLYEHGLVSDS